MVTYVAGCSHIRPLIPCDLDGWKQGTQKFQSLSCFLFSKGRGKTHQREKALFVLGKTPGFLVMQRKAQSWFWNAQVETRTNKWLHILIKKSVFLVSRRSYHCRRSFCSLGGGEAFLISLAENRELGLGWSRGVWPWTLLSAESC